MEVKLIAIDVDGTLLNDHYEITDRTKQAIAEAHKAGIKIVLATGRGPTSCFPIIEELQLTDPLITHNGAVVYHPRTQARGLELGMSAMELEPVIAYCREKGIHFDVSTALEMYIEGTSKETNAIYTKFNVNPTLIPNIHAIQEQIVKFTLLDTTGQKLDQAMKELTEQYPAWCIIRSGNMFIDIMHPQATKGYALQFMLRELDFHPSQVVSFGNYYNDVEMIKLAGLGIAMQNSPQDIHHIADRVALSNNEDGVAVIIEELLTKDKG